jgi:NAD+ synthase
MAELLIASAQINPIVGDIAGNLDKARAALARARADGADLAVLPEMVVLGYPAEDLVLKPACIADVRAAVEAFAAQAEGPPLLLGLPWAEDGKLYNIAALIEGGRIAERRAKHELPNYTVFDEKRVFASAPPQGPITVKGAPLGVAICEDIWLPTVCGELKARGAELILSPNGSPYRRQARAERLAVARARAAETGLPLLYVNQVGGQDELCFDGGSFALQADGSLAHQSRRFAEDYALTRWRREAGGWRCIAAPASARIEDGLEADYAAAMLALRDYVNKNRFPGVVLGLSGGIDSALSAALAVDALGPERVWCVMLPSAYTSAESLEDAAGCARALGVRLDTISIAPAVEAFAAMTSPVFAGRAPDIAEENIQSRARAVTLMALSNKFGPMVLTTGNKSEMAVGYATLYGDMCGGYNALKDLYKTEVLALSRWRDAHKPEGALGPDGPVMPERVHVKPPSAELRPDQKDEDSLPPYSALDDILRTLVDHEGEVEDLLARGHAAETVMRVQGLLYAAEYKRRQAPPGVKISERGFGRDRRYPITNRYRDQVG